jgi:phenylacetate-CoA ligase
VFCYNPMRCHVEVIDADASGYGELCFTLNDRNAIIPLPRFATGDHGRLVDRAMVCKAAALAGSVPPWLPVVLVCGRSNDRMAGLPSVEEIKEILYAEHDLADRLSGAFRIGRDPEGHVSLVFQTALEGLDTEETMLIAARAVRHVNRYLKSPVRVDVVTPDKFPARPMLDFERKFSYLATWSA